MKGKALSLLAVLLLVITASCAGGSGSAVGPDAPAVEERSTSLEDTDGQSERDIAADYEGILENPGQPGVDYNPLYISVSYRRGAVVPKGLSGQRPSGLSGGANREYIPAANCGNAILRRDRSYEALTDSIALRYGLAIESQAYLEHTRFAMFRLKNTAQSDAILAALRSEFASALEFAWHARICRPAFTPNDPDYLNSGLLPSPPGQWSLHKINADEGWDFSRGSGSVRVAVVDSGVLLSHEELSDTVLNPQSEFPGDQLDVINNDNTVEDANGHGTFIAGISGAAGNNGRTIIGLSHLSPVIPIKIANGDTTEDGHIIEGCLLGAVLGAKVVNISWGRYGPGAMSFRNMADDVTEMGSLLVAAAGNDNVTDNHWPSSAANAMSVGSTASNDARSGFSNFADDVDIAAPGEFLKSCSQLGNSSYVPADQGFGTSFSAPLVASAAALLWSFAPDLTVAEVRDLLEQTGAPTTGFTESVVRRLDIGAAFDELGRLKLAAPELDQLIHSGVLDLEPQVGDTATSVELRLNGALVETKTSAPWTFQLDTTSINFGNAIIEFIASDGSEEVSARMDIVIDNSAATFPLAEDFEGGALSFAPVDVKHYSEVFLENLKAIPDNQWTQDLISSNGPAQWGLLTSGAFEGQFGVTINNYGAHELDVLVSKRINLNAGNPTMVFRQRYNIEDGGSDFDKGWVYVSADNGRTFAPASKIGGSEAFYSGVVPAWITGEIDLSAFSGQSVHIAFVLESDGLQSGEDLLQPAVWSIDDIVVSTDFSTNVPTIGGLNFEPFSIFGSVPGKNNISVDIIEPEDVASVRYILDIAPLGSIGLGDVIVNRDNLPFAAEIAVPEVRNQLANLRVQFFNAQGDAGPEFSTQLYLFNLAGDVNADGDVDAADLTAFPLKVGIDDSEPGYVPFYDTDLDGLVTEADASGVGYNWGESL